MSQIVRPIADFSTFNIASGNYTAIDEITANDADYIRTQNLDPSGTYATYCCQLGTPQPPSSGPCTLRYRVRRTSAGGDLIQATPQFLYDGTLIDFEGVWHDLSISFQTFTWEPDLSVVTDWSKLQPLILIQNNAAGSNSTTADLSWLELELPDPAPSGMMLMF